MPKGLYTLYKKLLNVTFEQYETIGDNTRRLLSCVAICSRLLIVSELSKA